MHSFFEMFSRCVNSAGRPHSEGEHELRGEPYSVVAVYDETVMGMSVVVWESADDDLTSGGVEVANTLAKGVRKPDVVFTVNTDAGNVRSCTVLRACAGTEVDTKTFIFSRFGVEFANISSETFGVPDISRPVRGDEVWASAVYGMFCDFDSARCGGLEAANLVDPYVVFGEPDGTLGVDGDTVRVAVWCGDRIFYQGMCLWIEEADGVGAKFGEPEVSLCIKDQVEGSTAFSQWPVVPGPLLYIIFAKGVGCGLCEPDLVSFVYYYKERA